MANMDVAAAVEAWGATAAGCLPRADARRPVAAALLAADELVGGLGLRMDGDEGHSMPGGSREY